MTPPRPDNRGGDSPVSGFPVTAAVPMTATDVGSAVLVAKSLSVWPTFENGKTLRAVERSEEACVV